MVRKSSQGTLGRSVQAGWGEMGRNDAVALMEHQEVHEQRGGVGCSRE